MSWRVTFALFLMVVYYGGAIAVVAALLFFPVAMFTISTEPPNILVAIICVALAGLVAWNIFPRRFHVAPAGPRLTPESQPRLFSLLEEVARDVGQHVCDEVYLVLNPNLSVVQQRSRLGFGKGRLLTLGMPLLQVLNRRQLRAALAHEHGHFSQGRSFADPWIYQCRLAMIRAVESSKSTIFPFHLIFKLYAKLFLRVTQSVARRHEVAADEIAIRTLGSRSCVDTLQSVAGAGLAFFNYMNGEVVPVLQKGLWPPISEGFDLFRRSPQIARATREGVARIEIDDRTGALDTHPALHERLDLARKTNAPESSPREDDGDSAWNLLEHHELLEDQVVRQELERPDAFSKVSWSEVGDRVYLPSWERALQQYRESLKGVRPRDVAEWIDDPVALVQRFTPAAAGSMPFEARMQFVHTLIGAALGVALRRQGYTIGGPPNEELYLEKDGHRCKPFEMTARFFSGEMTSSEWLSVWQTTGSSDRDLSHLAPTTTPVPEWEPRRAPRDDEALVRPKTEYPWWLVIGALWLVIRILQALGDR